MTKAKRDSFVLGLLRAVREYSGAIDSTFFLHFAIDLSLFLIK